MKTLIILLSILALAASSLPPMLPSSFWGYTSGFKLGDKITATVPGYTRASTTIFAYGDQLVYTIDVPGDADNSPEGQTIEFAIKGKLVATAIWHSGTNVHLDLGVRGKR
jgi:hypothetical protein